MLPKSKSLFARVIHILSSGITFALLAVIAITIISPRSTSLAAENTIPSGSAPQSSPMHSENSLLPPSFTVTKQDALLVDADGDTQADPGDTIGYTVDIANTGPDPATGVVFTDTIDTNTTLVVGSVETTPLARGDSFSALGNVRISQAAPGVLANDNDPDGGTVTVTAFDAISVQGGNVVVNADGSFSYDPPAGYEGTDTFNYTITDNEGDTNSDTVTITISGMIWFINNNAAACTTAGCGRLSNPFSTLAAFNALNDGTGNNPASSDNIFIYESATGYSGAVTLLTGQKLIGQDATATLTAITGLTPPAGSDPLPTMNSGNATETSLTSTVTLNTNVTVRGLRIDSTTSTGMNDPAPAITGVSVSEVKVVTTTGTGVNFAGTAGSLNFIQLTTSGGTGANLVGNAGGTFTFSTVSVSSGANPAFVATGGGTINVCDENPCNPAATGALVNTLTSTTGTALNVANTTIGANNLEFRSISATGAVNGIVLNTTGSTGRLVVKGNGGNCTSAGTCTGGAIQNTTGDGVLLTNTTGASLTRLFVGGSANHGINASISNGLTLTSAYITNSGNGDNEHGLNLVNVQGTITLDGTTFNNASEDLVHLENNNVNATFNVTNNSQFSHPSTVGGFANSAILLLPGGTSALTVSIQNSTFTNIRNAAAQIGANLLGSNGTQTFTFSNNTINITLAGRASGVTVSGQEATRTDITISGNTFSGAGGNGVISLDTNDTSIIRGLVSGNTITNPPGIGIFVAVDEAGRSDVTLDSNTITNSGGDGIQTVNFGGVGVSLMDMTITNNQVNGHSLNTGVNFVGGMSFTTFEDNSCIVLRDNTVTGTPPSPTQCGGAPCVDYYLEEVGGVGTMEEIPNTGDTTASAAYVNSINDAGPVTIFGFIDLTNGAVCNVTGLGLLPLNDPVPVQEPVETETVTLSSVLATNALTPLPHALSTANVFNTPVASETLFKQTGVELGKVGVNETLVLSTNDLGVNRALLAPPLRPTQSGETVNIVISILPPGKSITVRFNVTVDNPFPAGSSQVCNQSTILSNELPPVVSNDPDTAAANDPTCTPINLEADLSITKTDGVATAVPGTPITYTITAANAGPQPDPTALVVDTFPATITGVTWTCVGAGGATCPAAGAGNINTTVNLPVGGSVTFTANGTISAAATGSLVNTATITPTIGITDPVPANNSATDTNTLTPQADVSITKTDGQTTDIPGTSIVYTIVAANAGPSNAPSVTIADTFPATLTGVTWTCVGAGGATCTAAGAGNINDVVNLPAGGSVTYTVNATIAASATGTLSNTATATVGGGVTDPVPGNNSATDNTTLTPQADVSITKTDGQTTDIPGTSIVYTIVAANVGPSNAPSVTIADTFPAILTGVTWTCVGAGGGSCTAAGAGNINDVVNLPAGGSVTYTVNATIAASATGTLSNTATATVGGGVTDPTPGNNSATDTTTLTPQADLSITKTDGQATAVPGQTVIYTIVAANAGPSNDPTAAIADTFPAILTGVTWTCVGAGGATCTPAGAGNINDTANLPVGGSVTYTASGTINADATGTLVNTATVTSSITDPTPGNNSATDTNTLTPQADLSITKTDGQATAVPGQSITYTIVAANAGPSDAPGATVADTFPPALTGVTWTCVSAGGASCTAAGSGNINDIVNLPAGSSVTYTANAVIDAGATGTLVNTATVTAPGGVTDPTPGNNSATDTDTLTPTTDLSITKTDGLTVANPGQSTTYTITVSSAGPSTAVNATVADTFSPDLTGVTWTCAAVGGATCTAAGAGDINDSVNLPPGSSLTYIVNATIDAGATGTLVNTATITAPGGVTDPVPGNNSATDNTSLDAPPVITNFTVTPGTIDENDTVDLSVTFTDPNTPEPHEVVIDWGDGITETINLPIGVLTASADHQYLDDNPTATPSDDYTVTVMVNEPDGGTDSDTAVVTVNNVAPALSGLNATNINENGTTTLSGTITDPGTLDTFTLVVDWGDGSAPEQFNYAAGTTNFSETHTYLDDDPSGTPSDNISISLTLTDDDTGSDTDSATITVSNVAPTLSNITVNSPINENEVVTVTGTINDPGTLDTFTLTVDWGDGSAPELFNYAAGTTSFNETHTYLDDNPTGTPSDVNTIALTLTDDDTGTDTAAPTVTVNNLPPALSNVTATPLITETDFITLTGSIVEVGTQDTFTLTVDWADGNVETFTYPAGTTSFLETHQYLDGLDWLVPLADFPIDLTLEDDDTGSFATSITVTVNNEAPTLSNVTFPATVDEGDTATLTGNINEISPLDTFTLFVDWGDGITETFSYPAAATAFTETHTYPDDDPTGTPSDTHTVILVLSDDEGGSDVLTTSVTVNNVAPVLNNIVIPAVNENEAATLTADLIDPGVLDTFDVVIDWGDGITETFTYGAGTTAIAESHVYLDDNPTGTPSDDYTVTLSIVDDDTGAGSATGSVTVNNVAPIVNAGPDQVVQLFPPVEFNGAFTDTGTLDTHEIVWDMGDGTIVTGTLTPTHLYSSEGTYLVTLTVTDDDTGVGTDTMQVIVDDMPTAVTLTDLGGSSSTRPTLLYFFLLFPGVAIWLLRRRYVKA